MGRGWGFLSTLKIKQKRFCPKKGFIPSRKIHRKDYVHLKKMSGWGGGVGGLYHVAEKKTKQERDRDYVLH